MMSVIMVIELYRKQEKPFDSLAHTFFSVLYTAVPFSLFPFSAFAHYQIGLDSILAHSSIEFSPGIILDFLFCFGQMIQVLILSEYHLAGIAFWNASLPKNRGKDFWRTGHCCSHSMAIFRLAGSSG